MLEGLARVRSVDRTWYLGIRPRMSSGWIEDSAELNPDGAQVSYGDYVVKPAGPGGSDFLAAVGGPFSASGASCKQPKVSEVGSRHRVGTRLGWNVASKGSAT